MINSTDEKYMENENSIDNSMWSDRDRKKIEKLNRKYEKKRRKELLKLEKRKFDAEIYKITKDLEYSTRLSKLTTTKVMMYLILINCVVIEAYSMWVMYVMKDLGALYTLISAVITQSVSYAIYCVKSHKDTKSEVDSKLERDRFEYESSQIDSEIQYNEQTDITDANG